MTNKKLKIITFLKLQCLRQNEYLQTSFGWRTAETTLQREWHVVVGIRTIERLPLAWVRKTLANSVRGYKYQKIGNQFVAKRYQLIDLYIFS